MKYLTSFFPVQAYPHKRNTDKRNEVYHEKYQQKVFQYPDYISTDRHPGYVYPVPETIHRQCRCPCIHTHYIAGMTNVFNTR